MFGSTRSCCCRNAARSSALAGSGGRDTSGASGFCAWKLPTRGEGCESARCNRGEAKAGSGIAEGSVKAGESSEAAASSLSAAFSSSESPSWSSSTGT